jgi:hypothetical protein
MTNGKYGKSRMPRVLFEVTPEFRREVDEKLHVECTTMKDVGTELFRRWLDGEIKMKTPHAEDRPGEERALQI